MDLPEFGIEELRRTVALLNNCNETFNQRFTAEQLLKIGDAYRRCGWDITPDEWTEAQVRAALRGEVPTGFGGERVKHPLQTLLEEVGGEYQLQSYSGRAMYGDHCLAATGNMAEIVAAIVEGCLEADLDLEAKREIEIAIRAMHTDAMGRDTVVYFPHVAYFSEVDAHLEGA